MRILASLGLVHAAWEPDTPFGFEDQSDFDFPETPAELANGWSLAERCGREAVAGSDLDQRNDIKCPNIILMNTDDMSWADVSINNPSKQMPTPNIDRLVSKERIELTVVHQRDLTFILLCQVLSSVWTSNGQYFFFIIKFSVIKFSVKLDQTLSSACHIMIEIYGLPKFNFLSLLITTTCSLNAS